MDVKETLDCMNSDFKLWDKASSKELGKGKVEKTLTLPWGIGEVVVTLEGMTDAGKRRSAVAEYGSYIRELIKDKTADEAVTARAQQAAAAVKQRDSTDSDIIGGGQRVREPAVQEETDAPAIEAHEEPSKKHGGLRETLIDRRTEIKDEIEFYTRRRDHCERELKRLAGDSRAVEAGLEALGEEDPK